MVIPLRSEMYHMSCIGRPTEAIWCGGFPHGKYRYSEDKNTDLIAYDLSEAARRIIEDTDIPSTLNPAFSLEYVNGSGVSLIVPDHGFGRGLLARLLGWRWMASAPKGDISDKLEAALKCNGQGEYIRSRLYGTSA